MCPPLENDIHTLMQQQSKLQEDTKRTGHFLTHEQSTVEPVNNHYLLVEFLALPSTLGDPLKALARNRIKHDTCEANVLNLKSLDTTKVYGVLQWYHCVKPQCICSPVNTAYTAATTALQQKMDSISNRFHFGGLLFEGSHHLGKLSVH